MRARTKQLDSVALLAGACYGKASGAARRGHGLDVPGGVGSEREGASVVPTESRDCAERKAGKPCSPLSKSIPANRSQKCRAWKLAEEPQEVSVSGPERAKEGTRK